MRKFYLIAVMIFTAIYANAQCDCTNEAVTGVPQAECEALVALYNTNGGVNWYDLFYPNWNTTSSVDSWGGVTVNGGHVTILDLHSNTDFEGVIPSEIKNLPYLTKLDFDKVGGITSIPTEIGELTNLQELGLGANLLTSLPVSLVNLVNLTELNICLNSITVSDATLKAFLDTKLPGWETCQNNAPPSGCDCASQSVVPQSECEALVTFYNSTNGVNWTDNTNWNTNEPIHAWEGISINDGHIVNIALKENNLTGSLPSEIGDLTYLTGLTLQDNNLLGELPQSIGELTKMERLSLYNNNFYGNIPTSIGNLTKLRDLYLGSNNLSGPIPSSIWNIISLERFEVFNQNISGEISHEIGNLVNLTFLGLAGNNFSGEIPSSFINLTKIVDGQFIFMQ